MSEKNNFQVKVDQESIDLFDSLCEKYAIKKTDALPYLINLASKHGLFEKDWVESLFKDQLRLYAEREKIRLESETYLHDLREGSKEKDRQNQRAISVMNYYLKGLNDSERREFFSREIHESRALRGDEPQALPELTQDGKIKVRLNGSYIFAKEMKGEEAILFYNDDRKVKCSTGYHLLGSWCSSCEEVNNCSQLRRERIEAIGKR